MSPELIFPVWLYSSAKTFVSEIQSFYPPALFYLVNILNKISHNLLLSVNLIQLSIVIIIDTLLFYYLNKKFNFKFAAIGLAFYIPWQVFFRGNYLWFDLATIPFMTLSFFYFYDFIIGFKTPKLLIASFFLSFGYLFKNTIFWIYILYLVWLVYLKVTKKQSARKLFRNLLFLFLPLILTGVANFLILTSKGTFEFTFYWNILMQNVIYPRMDTSPRLISPNFYVPMAFVIAIYLTSCLVIEKASRISQNQKYFLYSFTLVSLANIFPRWSDFHVQPFVFFLTIIFSYSLYLSNSFKKSIKVYFNIFLSAVIVFSTLILGNRIATEIKNRNRETPDNIALYAPQGLNHIIKNKNIFVYDFPLYNGVPLNDIYQPDFYKNVNLVLKDPDKYYRITSWQTALGYVKAQNPDIIIVPYQIHNRIIAGIDLTAFEKLIQKRYQHQTEIGKIYFIYGRSQD